MPIWARGGNVQVDGSGRERILGEADRVLLREGETSRHQDTTLTPYAKDDRWYYAGVYKGFRMRDLTPEEYKALPIPVRPNDLHR